MVYLTMSEVDYIAPKLTSHQGVVGHVTRIVGGRTARQDEKHSMAGSYGVADRARCGADCSTALQAPMELLSMPDAEQIAA